MKIIYSESDQARIARGVEAIESHEAALLKRLKDIYGDDIKSIMIDFKNDSARQGLHAQHSRFVSLLIPTGVLLDEEETKNFKDLKTD